MADNWYDKPGDFQSGSSNYSYSPSGTQSIDLPGKGWRMPWEKTWTPNTWLTSPDIRRWEQTENILHNKLMSQIDEINALEGLLEQFQGSGDFITQRLIQNSIGHIRSRMEDTDRAIGFGQIAMMTSRNIEAGVDARDAWAQASEDYNKAQLKTPWNERGQDAPEKPDSPGTGWNGIERWENMTERPLRSEDQKNFAYEGIEFPSWMSSYMTESGLGKGQGEDDMAQRGFGLAPLSARADLEPEDLSALQGYMGWTKAGNPMEYSGDYVSAMQNVPQWWEQYAKVSQKLFPTSGKGRQSSWSTARQ